MCMPSPASSATRRSWSWCRNPHSRHTASASASTSASESRSASSSSSRSTPSGPQRSRAAIRRSGGTIGGGWPAHSRYSSGRAWRPSSSTSVKPSVASSAVRATLPSSSAFVPTVMPCTKRSTSGARAPARSSAASTAAMTPSDWSAGVLGALAVTKPSGVSSAASVNVPPTSTPRSIGALSHAPPTRRDEAGLRGSRREVLLEVLVRRAVLAARQRHPLARRALARARVAGERRAVEAHAFLLAPVDVLAGDLHIAIDRPVHPHLTRHREVEPDVVEQRARRSREVVPVGGETLEGRLTRAEERLPVLRDAPVAVFLDQRCELSIERATELIHALKLPPCLSIPVPSIPRLGYAAAVCHRRANPLRRRIKPVLRGCYQGSKRAGDSLDTSECMP